MPTLTTLVNFNGTNGLFPYAGLIADDGGDLFGTTHSGGTSTTGTVFEIVNTSTGYATTPTILLNFNGTNGQYPVAGLIADAAGDLVGTAQTGGAYGYGTVFEIANTGTGYATTPAILLSFNGANGADPAAGLIADPAGDLFGTTYYGGESGAGVVFEIANTGTGYASTPTTLVSFNFTNGNYPSAGLIADAAGDLFGTTYLGGASYVAGRSIYGSDGTVFEIANTSTGYASTPTTLVSFNDTNGANPDAGLIADAAGDLFGTTYAGGANSDGTVFEIANTGSGYASTPTILLNFNGTNGAIPDAGLIADAAGNLFGTTSAGGASSDGTVFEIANTGTGYAGTPTILLSFNGTNGANPQAGLTADAAGDLFGTTSGGASGGGTAFELTDTGFQPACYLRGTRILTDRGEAAVEDLRIGELARTVLGGTAAPIIWIGHRRVDCARHPKPRQVWPVRVASGAFGPGRPHTDLYLSPDHAIYVNAVLIPVKHLVNGSTIAQVPVDQATYYHIELPRHDVLLAQGLPAESYLDTGDRANFANGGGPVRLFPDFSARVWEAHGCAPPVVTGPALEAARRRVNARAGRRAARARKVTAW